MQAGCDKNGVRLLVESTFVEWQLAEWQKVEWQMVEITLIDGIIWETSSVKK